MNKQLEKIWEEIESWNDIHANTDLGSYLNDPASDHEIDDLNKQLGGRLPVEFLDSLRRHNGTTGWTTEFCNGYLFGTKSVLSTLHLIRDIAKDLIDANIRNGDGNYSPLITSGSVKSDLWSEGWIPFHATDWSNTCFDFDPEVGGEMGQIICVNWEGNSVSVVAKNYVEFLALCAKNLPDNPDEDYSDE
ncbi:SMI1/KNR4 family protein [Undibacterium sp. Ji83W]|uniref:SMI1/KNR4 family protein n=1 Tax=Undibacterium sp. Ji83W TaxID=3413043 RepID=UPI003BF1ECD8